MYTVGLLLLSATLGMSTCSGPRAAEGGASHQWAISCSEPLASWGHGPWQVLHQASGPSAARGSGPWQVLHHTRSAHLLRTMGCGRCCTIPESHQLLGDPVWNTSQWGEGIAGAVFLYDQIISQGTREGKAFDALVRILLGMPAFYIRVFHSSSGSTADLGPCHLRGRTRYSWLLLWPGPALTIVGILGSQIADQRSIFLHSITPFLTNKGNNK